MKKIYLLPLATLIYTNVNAQRLAKADTLYNNWEYYKAAKIYEKKAKKHPTADIYFKLGECYQKMDKYKEAQAAYDKVNAAGPYNRPTFYLDYGEILKNNGQYDQAKIAFDKYNQLMPADPRGNFFSQSIDIVNEDHKTDVPVEIVNVSTLNSANEDFSPVLYKDGIVFTTSRMAPTHKTVDGWTGDAYLQLYYAKKTSKDTLFTDVVPFGGKTIDQKYHDGPVTFSKNYDTLYTSRVEKDLKGEEKKTLKIERNKIFMSTMKDGSWSKVVAFPYNSDTFSVSHPYLMPDASRIYFVSDMPGGYGETDIYYCNREGTGWSKPINMGPNINTFNREKFPVMAADSNFYFASDGYQGFGGLDICVALNKNGSLQKAIPMKYPFNSYTDDYGIMFLKNGKIGYISSDRYAYSRGDDDILYFDLSNDSDLVTSIYTIGYQPKPHVEILAATPLPKDTVVAGKSAVEKLRPVEKEIYFDFNKYNIRPDAVEYLDSVAIYLKAAPDSTLSIGGHCDSRGTPEYNMVLSNERDNAVIQYLHKKGISSKRIRAKGYGLTQMVNRCVPGVECTEEEHQANRRVEFDFKGNRTERTAGQKDPQLQKELTLE